MNQKGTYELSLKPVHTTRSVIRWLTRHNQVSEEWIESIVLWTPHPVDNDQFTIKKVIKIKGKRKKITLWIRNYNWRYLVYKIHMEKLK